MATCNWPVLFQALQSGRTITVGYQKLFIYLRPDSGVFSVKSQQAWS